ncbi:protoporphyrinogen oxidase HemJ [Pedobacter gandavensis]|uniref:Protoporphyrinogen IX oxidase n=1 Tax=Pedobacter gandavensis TaxID=2679963 RepID=A0ABR6F3F3_9SPHI|nr:protoporphyrinogen oxidase HemJ [Pedobacter gandavensis]MBB2151782.1 protoporphyrinogen oxidase HemJ [Pedobacter gandavensis]
MEYYYYVLSVHIIFVVSWMAGLFYSVRLFIYHVEAETRPELERNILQKEYERMEAKLWHIIATPAMVLTVAAGVTMICLRPNLLTLPWFHVKLGFVVLLLIYHFICQRIMNQLKLGKCKISSFKLRLWNEVATILLVAIVFTVVLKNAVNWIYGLVGLAVFSCVIMMGVKWYKSYRKKHDC